MASPSEDGGIGLHEDVNLDTIMKTHTESDTVVWWQSVVHGFTGWKWGEGRREGGGGGDMTLTVKSKKENK